MKDGPRIGFFGRLGSGNLGNDASLEALLGHLGSRYPTARFSAMCSGPERVTERYGFPTTRLHFIHRPSRRDWGRFARLAAAMRVGVGVAADAVRTARWVRRQDAVFVAGMGVLEATTMIRPWQEPYSLFLLALLGRLFNTKVALVSVGASPIPQWHSRWLLTTAAKHVHYLSYRDEYSRSSMSSMGVARVGAQVFPDLVFALPMPSEVQHRPRSVAVGVMAYWGGSADAHRRDELHDAYLSHMKRLVSWLLDSGHEVQLLIGDADDVPEAEELLADAVQQWHGEAPAPIDFEKVSSTTELVRRLSTTEMVVATRYHNVLISLACGKPTVAIAYGSKHTSLMEELGLGDYCQDIRAIDDSRLHCQVTTISGHLDEVRTLVTERARRQRELVMRQFEALDVEVLGGHAVRSVD